MTASVGKSLVEVFFEAKLVVLSLDCEVVATLGPNGLHAYARDKGNRVCLGYSSARIGRQYWIRNRIVSDSLHYG